MKKSVYYSGIACSILMLLGCMFKIMHWPGANIMLMLSVFLFCFYFLPFAVLDSYKSRTENKNGALHLATFITFFVCIMGVLFKVLHWPGAGALLIVGLPLPFVLFLPVYLNTTKHEKKDGPDFLGIMFGLTFLAVFSVLLALTVSKQVLGSAIIKVYANEQSTAVYENVSAGLKGDQQIKTSADEVCDFIDNLKCELLRATGNAAGSGDPCENGKIKAYEPLWGNTQLDSKVATGNVLNIDRDNDQLEVLKSKIKNFHGILLASKRMNEDLTELSNSLFDVNNKSIPNMGGHMEEFSWERREFSNMQLIFVLDGLTQIESNVRLVEAEIASSK